MSAKKTNPSQPSKQINKSFFLKFKNNYLHLLVKKSPPTPQKKTKNKKTPNINNKHSQKKLKFTSKTPNQLNVTNLIKVELIIKVNLTCIS